MSVDDESDLQLFVSAHINKVPAGIGEVKYERNPVLQPQNSPLSQAPPQIQAPPQSSGVSGGLPQSSGGPAPPSPQQSSGTMAPAFGGPQGSLSFPQQHGRNFSQGASPHQPTPSFSSSISPTGPPQLGALSFQSGQPGSQFQPQSHQRQVSSPGGMPQGPPAAYRASPPPGQSPSGPPSKPVFGVPLDRLYERDGLAVPLVVYQCLQAVDMFGLTVEGIYRQSGSLTHIQKLKAMFDNGMHNLPVCSLDIKTDGVTDSQSKALDFRNPENFFQDVNSVTGLLKQFLRDLPDPLLTGEHHDALVAAASTMTPILYYSFSMPRYARMHPFMARSLRRRLNFASYPPLAKHFLAASPYFNNLFPHHPFLKHCLVGYTTPKPPFLTISHQITLFPNP